MVNKIEKKLSPMQSRIAMAMRRGFVTPLEIAEDLGYSPVSVHVTIGWLKQQFPDRVVGIPGYGHRFMSLKELEEK